jgi:hypothetical protein
VTALPLAEGVASVPAQQPRRQRPTLRLGRGRLVRLDLSSAYRLVPSAVGKLDLRVKRDEATWRMLYGVPKFDAENPVSGTNAEEVPKSML